MENINKLLGYLNATSLADILDKIHYFQDKINLFNNFILGSDGDYHLKSEYNNDEISEIIKKYNIDISQISYVPIYQLDTGRDKINYACGSNLLEGWINVDFFEKENLEAIYEYKKVNLVERHPFKSEIFQFGYCEDFLEHLKQKDSIIFLSEIFRTFKKNGVFRVSFPGIEGVLKKHFNNPNDYYTGKFESYDFWDHEHFYSKEELTLVAQNIGFSEINFVEYGNSSYPELNSLDTRKGQIEINTYAELKK